MCWENVEKLFSIFRCTWGHFLNLAVLQADSFVWPTPQGGQVRRLCEEDDQDHPLHVSFLLSLISSTVLSLAAMACIRFADIMPDGVAFAMVFLVWLADVCFAESGHMSVSQHFQERIQH